MRENADSLPYSRQLSGGLESGMKTTVANAAYIHNRLRGSVPVFR